MNRALIYERNSIAHPGFGWPGPQSELFSIPFSTLDEVNSVGLMALDSEPFSKPTFCEAEPIVLRSPEAFNFQPCSLTILCSAYLKVIATLPTFECSKAAAAGPAFYLCRAGSKEPEKARGERGKEMQKQFQVCLSVGAHLSSLLGLCLWLPSPTAHRSQPFSIWGWQQGWQLGIERYS